MKQRDRIRALVTEQTKAIASSTPANRAKVHQEWEKKNKTELDLFESLSATIAKRSAPTSRLGSSPRKTLPEERKPSAPVRLGIPSMNGTGRVKGEVRDGTIIQTIPPAP